ncbi:MAG: TIGR03086 family metal-binding protein [Acidimicrobiales bacterium]|nr:TIGR03086 family metal-binding protein [Acidimicrobiales bacterium]
MQPTDQLAHILPTVGNVVEGIRPDQLDDPTPCDAFTVHDVLDHMMVLGGSFAYAFRGEEPPEISAPAVYGWVPEKEFRGAMDDLLDAVRSPGAMERTVVAPFGEVPGDTFARFVAFDGLVHGWDLARSTGQDYTLDPEVVAAVDDFARQALTPDMRDGDTFAAETTPPAGAGRLEQLVAFSGRQV